MRLKQFVSENGAGAGDAGDAGDAGPHGAKPYRILYVEDDDINWGIGSAMLKSTCELTRATNAAETFAVLGSTTFDAILMDIGLVGSTLNGIEITEVLRGKREAPPEARALVPLRLPIIFVTAFAAQYDRLRLLEAGGDEMLTKPVDFVGLFVTLVRLMREERRGVIG